MVEDPPREDDRRAGVVDPPVRRVGPRRSLPGRTGVPALGAGSPVVDWADETPDPPADIVLTPRRIYVTLELPGTIRETLEVTATNVKLLVRARTANGGAYRKAIDLPGDVDPDRVTAAYRNGVLDVTLIRVPQGGRGEQEGQDG